MTDEDYMRMALDEARRAEELGEVPIGAVVVYEPIDPATRKPLAPPQVIARACNRRETTRDPAGHAEFLALKQAAQHLDAWRLSGCTVYVTLEPCIMCAGLMHQARIERCVYGASDSKAGALGTLYEINKDKRLNHTFEAIPGVLGGECASLLRDFFAKRRKKTNGARMTNQNGCEASDTSGTQDTGAAAAETVDMFAVARIAQEVDAAAFSGPAACKLVAPAKVNLYLEIGEKRPDGYHDAVSIMHALMLHDVLRMKLAPAQGPGLSVELTCSEREGIAALDVEPQDNIVSKAIRLLAQKIGRTCDETMVVSIEKHIPAQAGLGGGSSDAAAALVGASHLWGIAPDDSRVEEVARSLGADVAFFLRGGCVCLTGVGDEFSHELEPMKSFVVLIRPEGGVSTAAAYRAFDEAPTTIAPRDREAALAATSAQDVPLRNNLVPASERLLPVLAEVRAWAQAHRDVCETLMSGSGSAVFAICPSFDAAARVAAQAQTQGWWARTTMFGPARAALVPNR